MSDEPEDLVTMTVNAELCIGAGQCEVLEAEVFYVDDDTAIAGIVGTGTLPRERADVVVDRCPAGAIGFD